MLTAVDHSVQGRLLQRVCFDSACGYEPPPLRRVTSTAVSQAPSPPSAVFGFHGAFVRFAWRMQSCPIAQQVPIRLYVCPHAAVCVLILMQSCPIAQQVPIRLYMCPHAAVCVSSCCNMCVLMLLYVCPLDAIYVSSRCCMCPHTATYVSSCCYICPHTVIYASACCYLQALYGGAIPWCINCQPGKYAAVEGARFCASCASGKWSAERSSVCTSCPAGKTTLPPPMLAGAPEACQVLQRSLLALLVHKYEY